MKLDDIIKINRVAYLLKRDQATGLKLALLYFISAKRKASEGKISDACLKSIQWLKRINIEVPDNIMNIEIPKRLIVLEKILADNRGLISKRRCATLVRAIPVVSRDIGLVPQYS